MLKNQLQYYCNTSILFLLYLQTTLAMSVLWALTGSMDTRLTLDGKANDVAFDSGSEQDRRTAEVQLRGTVNGKPFQINRRRGRKHELSFLCGEQDFTMQAVKDTQAKINEYLGVGDGKLQRCCFFGQHSHTMQVRSQSYLVSYCFSLSLLYIMLGFFSFFLFLSDFSIFRR